MLRGAYGGSNISHLLTHRPNSLKWQTSGHIWHNDNKKSWASLIFPVLILKISTLVVLLWRRQSEEAHAETRAHRSPFRLHFSTVICDGRLPLACQSLITAHFNPGLTIKSIQVSPSAKERWAIAHGGIVEARTRHPAVLTLAKFTKELLKPPKERSLPQAGSTPGWHSLLLFYT